MKEIPNLKVGDKLAFYSGRSDGYTLHSINKITPTGRIKCAGFELNPDLTIRGADAWSTLSVYVPTEEIMRKIKRDRIVGRLKKISWSAMPDDVLERVNNILLEGHKDVRSKSDSD